MTDKKASIITPPSGAVRGIRARWSLGLLATLVALSVPAGAQSQPADPDEQIITRTTFTDIAQKTLPSVVAVYVKSDIRDRIKELRERMGPLGDKLFEDPQLRRLLPELPEGKGDEGDEEKGEEESAPDDPAHKDLFETKTSGSGVILSEDGYIVTNVHIVENAKPGTISVVLNDDTEIPAEKVEVVALDKMIDIAVLKIDTTGLTLQPLKWGDSDKMQIGDMIVAIGNPLDLRGSVSTGIISAKARKIDKVQIEHLIQTDAMINPGNSGGALVNLDGELIGVNMAIATNSGFFQGIGFAIPSNDARFVTDQVMKGGKVRRGYIGIEMNPMTPELLSAFGITDKSVKGIAVVNVVPGAPADKAGVMAYDVLTEVDGVKIRETRDVLGIIASKSVGESANLKVMRSIDGQLQEVPLLMQVAERPSDADLERDRMEAMKKLPEKKIEKRPSETLGMELKPTEEPARGLEVVSVAPRSAAAMAQPPIAAGNIILEINRKPVETLEDFAQALKEGDPSRPYLIRFLDEGRRAFTSIQRKAEETEKE